MAWGGPAAVDTAGSTAAAATEATAADAAPKALGEMTVEELEAEIARRKANIAKGSVPQSLKADE